jgi:hypothetical protein
MNIFSVGLFFLVFSSSETLSDIPLMAIDFDGENGLDPAIIINWRY